MYMVYEWVFKIKIKFLNGWIVVSCENKVYKVEFGWIVYDIFLEFGKDIYYVSWFD